MFFGFKKYCRWISIGFLSIFLALVLPGTTVYAPPIGGNHGSVLPPPPLSKPSYQETRTALLNPWSIQPVHVGNIDLETLWLARAMFSESKRHDEQELVGWTVRNRYETQYRGCTSYQDCILDPFQFSAFLPSQPKLNFYTGLTEVSDISGWKRTLALAYYVRYADDQLRPFDRKVRHFYSQQSMLDPDLTPDWVGDATPVVVRRNFHLDEYRFRFYSGVR